MAQGTKAYAGLAVPLYGESTIYNKVVADDILTLQQGASATGSPFVVKTSASANVFGVNSTGMIRSMILTTVALASLSTNASQSVALSGVTTDDVALLFPTAGTVTGNGVFVAQVLTADKLTVFNAGALSCAATTANVWFFRTKTA